MHVLAILQMMALLTLANGAPVVAKKIFGGRFSLPLDCRVRFFDGRPLFGTSKTFRGIAVSILATTVGDRRDGGRCRDGRRPLLQLRQAQAEPAAE